MILSTAAPSLLAQADSKAEVIQKLVERVDALEREVVALQQVETPQAQTPQTPAQPAPVIAPQAVATEQKPNPTVDVADANAAQPDAGSRFNFHGYADVDFQRNVDGSTKKFELGEIDLFGTERLATHLTALMELVFETDDQQLVAQVPVNIERLLLQYRGNDFFNADIGSFRTAVGYYSTAYLRGAWL